MCIDYFPHDFRSCVPVMQEGGSRNGYFLWFDHINSFVLALFSRNHRLPHPKTLHQRNSRRTDERAGAALETVHHVVFLHAPPIVLSSRARPGLAWVQEERTGVEAASAADAV